jgi:hypothetical protein
VPAAVDPDDQSRAARCPGASRRDVVHRCRWTVRIGDRRAQPTSAASSSRCSSATRMATLTRGWHCGCWRRRARSPSDHPGPRPPRRWVNFRRDDHAVGEEFQREAARLAAVTGAKLIEGCALSALAGSLGRRDPAAGAPAEVDVMALYLRMGNRRAVGRGNARRLPEVPGLEQHLRRHVNVVRRRLAAGAVSGAPSRAFAARAVCARIGTQPTHAVRRDVDQRRLPRPVLERRAPTTSAQASLWS